MLAFAWFGTLESGMGRESGTIHQQKRIRTVAALPETASRNRFLKVVLHYATVFVLSSYMAFP
jgi:hypothetical protein